MTFDEFLAATLPEPHTVTVEAFAGTGAYGDTYSAGVEVTPCFVEHKRRYIKTTTQDTAGGVVVSSTAVYCPLGTTAPPGSRVTLPSGAVALVLETHTLDAAGLDLPEHVAIYLE